MDILNQLAEIRERQGLAPIDGTRIEGFEPGSPPPPPLPPEIFPSEPPEFPMEYDGDGGEVHVGGPYTREPTPSPLIDLGKGAEPPPRPAEPPRTPPQGLFVAWMEGLPCEASYQGRAVTLADKEKAAVVKVVLQALARTVRGQLAEVQALLPKRKRRKAAGGEHALAEGPSPAGARRRGRPRKVQA